MSEQDLTTGQEAAKKWQLTPTNVSCTLGVAGTAGIADFIAYLGPNGAHFGPNGILIGAIATLIAARHGEDIVNGVRDRIPQPILDAMARRFARGGVQAQLNRAQPKEEHGQLQNGGDTDLLQPIIDMAPTTPVYYPDCDDETVPLQARAMNSDLFTFSEVLASGFVPTAKKIFVGRTMEGKDIFVPAEDLCHVALAGKTGGGKGSLMRLLMVQLCYIGAKVLLLNPHYMRWVRAKDGPKFDEDWTPFEGVNPRTGKPYLEAPPTASADPEPIEKCLTWTVERLLQKRRREGREGGELFPPYFIVLDEWPDIASEIKKAPEYMGKLLRQGRKYGIFVIVASQDFQVKTTGMEGGSVRKCLLTCFYTGGDPTTAKELLYSEKPSSIPENKVGKGTVMLRCTGTRNEAILAKVPFVDNAAVYRLLGDSTFHGAKKSAVAQEEPASPLPQAVLPSVQKMAPPVQRVGVLTIEQILAMYETGKLSEDALLRLIDKLPVVQGDGERVEEGVLEQEADMEDLIPEVIDFQERRDGRRVDPAPAHVEQQPQAIKSATRNMAKYARPLELWNANPESRTSRKFALLLSTPEHPVSKDVAWKIIDEMDRLGLIQKKGQVS